MDRDILQNDDVPEEEVIFVQMANNPRFALRPATISDQVLDYSTPEGIKIYKSNTAALPIKFDLTTGKL